MSGRRLSRDLIKTPGPGAGQEVLQISQSRGKSLYPFSCAPTDGGVCEQMRAEAHQVPAVPTSAAMASGSMRNEVPQPISQGEG